MNIAIAQLEPIGKGEVVLEQLRIDAVLRGLCAETRMEQVYRNTESVPIEVVYTFPLPLEAVLLELTLELNGETLTGQVTARSEAEERYETAIEQGDSAVLLRQVEQGLYSVNVGNLLPGERAVIRYRTSQLYSWQGDSLRFQLPTTIAPRYGDPVRAGLQPHEVPTYSLTANHGFQLKLTVEGTLAQADFDCPSHPLAVAQDGKHRVFTLSGGTTLMDRDFVLLFKEREPTEDRAEGVAYGAKDPRRASGKGNHVVLASFHPVYPGDNPPLNRTFKLVLDCSGSMGGDSMRQAKQAVSEILDSLTEADTFNLTAFGSDYQLLFPRPRAASAKNLAIARRFVEQTDANRGGTEVGAALQASYRAGDTEAQDTDLLLITDGEVWDSDTIMADAKQSNHRIFTVGVGSAVSEIFVKRIAEVTGGACELVSPREQMADHIVRHFNRIRQPVARSMEIKWPAPLKRQQPEAIDRIFAGDTLHLCAWLDEAPRDPVTLNLVYEDGTTWQQQLILTQASDGFVEDLPRLATHSRLTELKPRKAKQLAVDYQLVSEYTSCVLVKARKPGEKADEAPELRQVPQMLAAGWAGTGAVMICESPQIDMSPNFSKPQSSSASKSRRPSRNMPSLPPVMGSGMEFLEIPASLRRRDDDSLSKKKRGIKRFGSARSTEKPRDTRSIDQLPGLPFSVLDELKSHGISVIQDLLDRSADDLIEIGLERDDIDLVIKVLALWRLALASAVK
jgi:Ca-activated chloride channel family protein